MPTLWSTGAWIVITQSHHPHGGYVLLGKLLTKWTVITPHQVLTNATKKNKAVSGDREWQKLLFYTKWCDKSLSRETCMLSHFSHVQLCVTPWAVACQAPLSMEFSRQENTGVSCHGFLQGIFLTQGSNPCFLHCRQILYCWATGEAPETWIK